VSRVRTKNTAIMKFGRKGKSRQNVRMSKPDRGPRRPGVERRHLGNARKKKAEGVSQGGSSRSTRRRNQVLSLMPRESKTRN